MELQPTAVRYIKLGEGGSWFDRCIREDWLELGYRTVPHQLAEAGDWAAIEDLLVSQDGRSRSKARSFVREVRDFYTLGSDCLWVTIGNGRLWWGFAEAEVHEVEGPGRGSRGRRMIGCWHDEDVLGQRLDLSRLSTRLSKVSAYQQTICTVGAEEYLLRRLNGVEEPVVARALSARQSLTATAIELIQALDWRDFEVLVDLIFANSGWRRVSAVGGSSQADTDLILEQVVTGERAFVQVKSSASNATFTNYVERFERDPTFQRMFFICHSPSSSLRPPADTMIDVWLGERLAGQAIRAGLFDWLIEKAR